MSYPLVDSFFPQILSLPAVYLAFFLVAFFLAAGFLGVCFLLGRAISNPFALERVTASCRV